MRELKPMNRMLGKGPDGKMRFGEQSNHLWYDDSDWGRARDENGNLNARTKVQTYNLGNQSITVSNSCSKDVLEYDIYATGLMTSRNVFDRRKKSTLYEFYNNNLEKILKVKVPAAQTLVPCDDGLYFKDGMRLNKVMTYDEKRIDEVQIPVATYIPKPVQKKKKKIIAVNEDMRVDLFNKIVLDSPDPEEPEPCISFEQFLEEIENDTPRPRAGFTERERVVLTLRSERLSQKVIKREIDSLVEMTNEMLGKDTMDII